VFTSGVPRLLPNAHGEVLTPSIVGLLESGEIVVGQAASELALTKPERTVATFKRWMGEGREVEIAGKSFTAPQLSSLVLRALKLDAEAALGQEIQEAVITVPAYFNENQRRATRNAVELAGLNVKRVVNEPTAAALSFGFRDGDASKLLLVFDLGGGTFDVTVMEIFEGTLEILSTAGESRLGGEDFSDALMAYVLERSGRMLEQAEVMEPLLVARLRKEAEAAKRKLGEDGQAVIRMPTSEGEIGKDSETLTLDAAIFESTCSRLIKRLRTPIERALRDARKSVESIDDVLLVGGATRMPVVRTLVQDIFGKPARTDVDPDQAVALGAAVQAALIRDDKAVEDVVLTDVCPFTLGIEIVKHFGGRRVEGYYMPIIHRNTTIPVSREERVFTVDAGQTELKIGVYQGEGRRTDDNLFLGELQVTPIPVGPAGQEVAVRFTYDINGLLEVEAYILGSQKHFQTVLKNNVKGMSEGEVKEALARMQEMKFYPRDKLENRRLLHFAEGRFQEVEPFSRDQLEQAVDFFEHALDSGDRELFDSARSQLVMMLSALGFPYDGKGHDELGNNEQTP